MEEIIKQFLKQLNKQKSISKNTEESYKRDLTKMFEFKTIEQIERLAKVLDGFYVGKNDLYKDEKKNCFYLLIQKGSHTKEEFNKVNNVISEYSIHRKYTIAKEAFLKEHGKLLIKGNALQIIGEI